MSTKAEKSERKSLRKMLSSRKKGKDGEEESASVTSPNNNGSSLHTSVSSDSQNQTRSPGSSTATSTDRGRSGTAQNRNNNNGTGVLGRLRSRSRSRRTEKHDAAAAASKELLVAVTSCRSDGYYNEKAPGSVSKLPRKAPTNLKMFHELAVGVKDAYEAVNATPRRPTDDDQTNLEADEFQAKLVLWDFVGNLNFVSFSYFYGCTMSEHKRTLQTYCINTHC